MLKDRNFLYAPSFKKVGEFGDVGVNSVIYTEGVNVIEDCIGYLFDLGAKSVILYVTAKTR